MQLVMLAGELGAKYGQQHKYYDLRTPADAIKLLCINYPKLKQDLITAHHNGIGYKVIQGNAAMSYDELHLPFGSKPLLVVPVISGSGSGGVSQILIGVGLVAASFLLPGAGLFGTTSIFGVGALTTAAGTATIGTLVGTSLSAIGAGLILSGTANLISPQPTLPNLGANRIKGEGTNVRGVGPQGVTRGASGTQSYAFTGPVNTAGTGATLPVVYGRVIAGSILLAANLEVSDESDPLKMAIQKPSVKTVTINGDKLGRGRQELGGIETERLDRFSFNSINERKVLIDTTFGPPGVSDEPLQVGAKITNDGLKYKESDRRALDVIFEVNKGLYDYIGAVGTTKIDGFITYKITVVVSRSGPDVTAATAQVTLQGLFNESSTLRYGHRFEMLKIPENAKKVDLQVEIIDLAVHETVKLKVLGYGYNLLS